MRNDIVAHLESLEKYSRLLDEAFRIPFFGFRVGLDPILKLVPIIGSTVGFLASLYPLHIARKLQVPAGIQLRMVANIAIDHIIGLIPFAGFVADAFWKANKRNCDLVMNSLAYAYGRKG